jgi:ABC-2 type transport system permease protein
MTFWRGLALVAGKEFRHLRRDPYTLVLTVAMPLAQMLLFGYALETRAHNIPTAVQDMDGGRFSRDLVRQFERSPVFRVTRRAASQPELMRLIRNGEVRIAIQIPPRYSIDAFYHRPVTVRVWVDGSDAAMAGQAVVAARSIGLEQAVGMTVAGTPASQLPLQLRSEVLFNPGGHSVNYFVPGLVAILVEMTVLLLMSLSFVKERERGTLDQVRITNITLGSLVGGKMLVSVVIGLSTGIVLTVLMRTVFGVAIHGDCWLYAVAMLCYMPPSLGLGLLLTAEARNQAQALQLTFLVGLPSILLSGFIFPRHNMPPAVLWLSALIPTTWSVRLARGIVLRGAGWTDLWTEFAVLFALGLAYLATGAWHLKRRLG